MENAKEIWEILKEVGKRLDDVGKRLDSVGERLDRLAKSQEETDRQIKELKKAQEETDKKLKELAEKHAETEEQIKKLSIQISKVSEEVRNTTRAVADLNGIWKDYTEDTIREGLEYALKELGFEGFRVRENLKSKMDGDIMEIDGLVLGDDYVIVLEVKTTLRVDDVDEFVEE
ncbi:MAG: hypothetical protein ABIL36_08350, partial [candidate division WOR-3 bacterium]